MGYFRFFFNKKNPLNYYLFKVKKCHGDSVKNESARAKKLEQRAPNAPPPLACLGLKEKNIEKIINLKKITVVCLVRILKIKRHNF